MTKRAFIVFLLLQWIGAAVLVALRPIRWVGADPSEAFLIGVPAGLLLFLVLVRQPLRLIASAGTLGARRLTGRALFLATNSLVEEILWRAGLLAALLEIAPPVGACAISAVGFAAMHLSLQGPRAALGHVLTGLVFGFCFLATGSLLAPFVAHLTYNLLFLGRTTARPLNPSLA